MSVRIIIGDALQCLRDLPTNSVHACVTSPPYYGLRSYLPEGHPDKHLEIGLQRTPSEYVAAMVDVFREVRRVLRDDGTVWLNLGDSYATGAGKVGDAPGGGEQGDRWAGRGIHTADNSGKSAPRIQQMGPMTQPNRMPLPGLKPKDLIGIPWRVAFALQDDGWWLRQDIIWHKPNPMPESVLDRCTKAHEYLFLLTKAERYFYDGVAIAESSLTNDPRRPYGSEGSWMLDGRPPAQRPNGKPRSAGNKSHKYVDAYGASETEEHRTKAGLMKVADVPWATRNRRSVWTVATQPYAEAHFATFPPDLIEPCIKAGTSERGCCATCGAPWVRIVTKGEPDEAHRAACGADASGGYNGQSTKGHDAAGVQNASDVKRRILEGMRLKSSEWLPSCGCDAAVTPCTVLDPFGGAGTTGLVADRLGRDAILIELNPEYCEMAQRRIAGDAPLFAEITA